MIIQRVEVKGLLGKKKTLAVQFHQDINIITGRNGAGKTSFMKLIWYVVSGNIILALKEIDFQSVKIDTDLYSCTLHKVSKFECRVELEVGGKLFNFEDEYDQDGDLFSNAEDQANPELMSKGSSVFFPTFRRIEGGFSLDTEGTRPNALASVQSRLFRAKSDIENGLTELSSRLTNDLHVFVASISTVDISGILLRKYTDLSEIGNKLQSDTSQNIITTIKEYKSDYSTPTPDLDSANTVLDSIKTMIESMERSRQAAMMPLDAIKNLVDRLFQHSGIKIDSRLSFGDAAKAVSSNSLSAGEKQMLSFICYNAFYKNSTIFIDEPELSLHVDWQRQLFPILQSQETSNQFIIATHSPFIYSKYPDKEIVLDQDRGDQG